MRDVHTHMQWDVSDTGGQSQGVVTIEAQGRAEIFSSEVMMILRRWLLPEYSGDGALLPRPSNKSTEYINKLQIPGTVQLLSSALLNPKF